jgi:SHS2 domain-containing protein
VVTEEHVGEWKVSFTGRTLEEVFAEVARVIADAAGEHPGSPGAWEEVALSARDARTLLVDWANELLGRSEAREMAYGEVRNLKVSNAEGSTARVTADIRGFPVRHWVSPLKAATYHALELERTGAGWRAVILFDV